MQRLILFVSLLCLGNLVLSQNVGGTTGPCSAFPIPPPYTKPITVFGSTPGAASTSSSACYSSASGPVVWYTITPTAGSPVNITTCNPGTNYDTVISVYTGSCNSLVCTTYNDDASCTHNNSTGNLSTLSFIPNSNTIYYIGVGGYSSSQGNFQLTVGQSNTTSAPSGCTAAVNVTGPYSPEITIFGSNVNATGFSYNTSPCNIQSTQHTVFYHINPIPGIPMTVSTCNPATNFDTVLHIFNGTNCNSLSCTASSDDNCTTYIGTASEIAFTPTGSSYYVAVSGFSSQQGSYEISFSQEGGGSNACSSALVVYSGNIYYGSTVGAPAIVSEPCNALNNHQTVWYKLVLNNYNPVTVTTCSTGTNFDTYLVVLSGDCNSLSCVAYNDDYTCSVASSNTSRITFSPTTSNYYILVSGYSLNTGSYELTISQ